MSRIHNLIEQYCPDGVPYKTLGEVGTFTRGSGLQKKDFTETGLPCIHYGQIYTHYGISATQTKSFISPAQAARLHRAQPGDLIIATTSENDEDVCKAVTWLGDGEVAYGGHSVAFHHSLDPKFVAYWFQSRDFQDQKRKFITGVKVREVSPRSLEKSRIPVPPLLVQEEIVRILDSFTQLEAELEAELEARRQQYEHFRRRLFADVASSGSSVWSTLGHVSSRVVSGGTPSSKNPLYYGGEIPWVRTQEVDFGEISSTSKTITELGLMNSSATWIPSNCVIVAMYGATAAKVATNSIPVTTNQACCNLQIDPRVAEYRYVFHWISSQYNVLRSLGEGSQSNISGTKVKSFTIPVPPLAEQRRVAATLDAFDSLVNDLSSGLPAEIEARRQQYEFYRDKLLSFEELSA